VRFVSVKVKIVVKNTTKIEYICYWLFRRCLVYSECAWTKI